MGISGYPIMWKKELLEEEKSQFRLKKKVGNTNNGGRRNWLGLQNDWLEIRWVSTLKPNKSRFCIRNDQKGEFAGVLLVPSFYYWFHRQSVSSKTLTYLSTISSKIVGFTNYIDIIAAKLSLFYFDLSDN